MKREITAKEVTEIAVVNLMNGKKTKVAIRNENGILEIKTKSVITQFLNPSNKRKKMTKKIAEAVSNNCEYYIMEKSASSTDFGLFCLKTFLFIYSVSRIDLSLFLTDKYDDNQKDLMMQILIDMINAIFSSLIGKESVEFTDLENIVLSTMFDETMKIDYDVKKMKSKDYYNMITVSSVTDEDDSKIQSLKEFSDFIVDLIESDDVISFSNSYGIIKNRITKKNIEGVNWKQQYLMDKYEFYSYTNILKKYLAGVKEKNEYIYANAEISALLNKINKAVEENKTEENLKLFSSSVFSNIIEQFKSHRTFIQLHAVINKNHSTFGLYGGFFKNIKTNRELIQELIDYVFYGVATKTGSKDDKYIEIVWNDHLLKYLKGDQKKFTNDLKKGLCYRIEYSLDETYYFQTLLWQFMFYAFGIDFYMIESKDDWLNIVDTILSGVEANKTILEINEEMEYLYERKQYEVIEQDRKIRFTPEEINFFNLLESIGFTLIKEIIVMLNHITLDERGKMDADNSNIKIYPADIFSDIGLKQYVAKSHISSKIDNLLNKVIKYIEVIECVLKAKTESDINELIIIIKNETNNWKYNYIFNACDENWNKYVVLKNELHELTKFFSALLLFNPAENRCVIREIEEIIKCYKKLNDLKKITYLCEYGESKSKGNITNKLNKEVWDSIEIKELYKALRRIVEYTKYEEYLKEYVELENIFSDFKKM